MKTGNDCVVDGGDMAGGIAVGIIWVKGNNCTTNLKNISKKKCQ